MSDNRSESIPMPSPIPPARHPTGSHAAIEDDAARALRYAHEAREGVKAIRADLGREPNTSDDDDEGEGIRGRLAMVEAFVGSPSNPVRNRLATGAHAWLEKLTHAIDKLTTELTTERKQRDEQAEAQAKANARRAEPRDRVAWIAVGALVATIVAQSVPALARWFASHLR